MTTYFVRKTGNDTSGNGSDAQPWLTLGKAEGTVPIGGGHTVKVGGGTYLESNYGGVGFLYCKRNFTDYVTFESESGNAADVVLQPGTDGGVVLSFYANAGHYRFRNLTFKTVVQSSGATIDLLANNVRDIEFEGCVISAVTGSALRSIFRIEAGSTTAISNISLTNCTITAEIVGASQLMGISLNRYADGASIDTISITNCLVSVNSTPINDVAATNVTISGGAYICSGSAHAGLFGVDGSSGRLTTGSISDAAFVTAGGHGLLIGAGCSGMAVTGVKVTGGNQGLVLKYCDSCTVTCSTISMPAGSGGQGLFFRGATNCTAQHNTISYSGLSGGACIYWDDVPGPEVSANNTATYNIIRALSNGVKLLSWNYSAGKGLGMLCDYNQYQVANGAVWGSILGSTIASLTALRAAWAGYGDGSNDRHSRIFVAAPDGIGLGLAWERIRL